jgi:AraC-like DNA-binding protein
MWYLRSGSASIGDGAPVRAGQVICFHSGGGMVVPAKVMSGYELLIPRLWIERFAEQLPLASFSEFLWSLRTRDVQLRLDAQGQAEAEWLLNRMLAEKAVETDVSRISMHLTCGQFLVVCLRYWGKSKGTPSTVNPSSEDVVLAVRDYIDEHLTEDLGLARLAHRAGYAQSYFSTLFARATGQHVTDYICGSRLEKACELLARTDAKIMKVCGESGFRDLAHFNRTFKKVIGVTPSQYRRFIAPRKRDRAGEVKGARTKPPIALWTR